MAYNELQQAVADCMLLEIQSAQPYASKETLLLRVLRKAAASFNYSLSSIVDPALIYLEPELQDIIFQCWRQRKGDTTTDDFMEAFLTKDYVRPEDLARVARNMNQHCSYHVRHLFAVDGFDGPEPHHYVEGLRYSKDDCRGRHVRAVRLMYDEDMPLARIYAIIQCVLSRFQNGTLLNEDNDLADPPELLNDFELKLFRNYVNFVGHKNLETIVSWKRMRITRRIVLDDSEVTKKKKTKTTEN